MTRIKDVIDKISPLPGEVFIKAQERLDNLIKPRGSLGKMEEVAKRIAAIKGKLNPCLKRKVIFVFAGDHGIAKEGVSTYPQEVTYQMVCNFLRGGAGINVLAKHVGAEVIVVDMGVIRDIDPSSGIKIKKIGKGTRNFLKEEAMSREQAIQSIEAGMEVFEEEYKKVPIDIVGMGDMGIANTTPSSAILAAITGRDPQEVTGRGTGVNGKIWQKKVKIIREALNFHHPDPEDPVDVLAKIGGYEIGGIAGCILAAAASKVPAVIDGFISTAGALIARQLCPHVVEYVFASHLSAEKGHILALDYLDLSPLLDLNMRLGEGTGAALAISIIEASAKILREMATFENAGVSREKTK